MAVDPSQLESDLLDFFRAPPLGAADCANMWAAILSTYAGVTTPPSTTVAAAALALQSTLTGIFATVGTAAAKATVMDAAFSAFSSAVGAGMAPAFAAVPPISASFNTGLFPPYPETHEIAADKWANLIHSWWITGIAVPPTGPTVGWT